MAAQGTSAQEEAGAVEGRCWDGLVMSGLAHAKGGPTTCFVLFYIIYILFMKPKSFGPTSLTKSLLSQPGPRVQALVSKWKILQDSHHYSVTQEGCQKHMEGLPGDQ